MIPIADSPRRERTPVVTWALIAVNVLAFLPLVQAGPRGVDAFFARWALVPDRIGQGGDFERFLTSMFVHGGLFHLLGNMWTLWIFGDNVEDRLGRGRFLAFYLTCGLTAGVIHYAFNASSALPTVGASGAISGVLGAYFLLFPKATLLLLVPIFFYPLFVTVPAVVYLAIWFVGQFLSGTSTLGGDSRSGGVAWWAHIGGFLAGVVFLRIFHPPRSPPRNPTWERTRGKTKRPWDWEARVTGRTTPPDAIRPWSARGRRRPPSAEA